MHFDDRLGTVLRMRANGAVMQKIQYRQLLDLLGIMPESASGAHVDMAYDLLAERTGQVPESDRIAMLDDPALRLRSTRLVAALALDEWKVAQAALRKAQLNEEQWLDLVPALPPSARTALRERDDLDDDVLSLLDRLGINNRGLPPAPNPPEPAAPETMEELPVIAKEAEDEPGPAPREETVEPSPVITLVAEPTADVAAAETAPEVRPSGERRTSSFPIFHVSEIEDIALSLTDVEPDSPTDRPAALAEAEIVRAMPELAPDADLTDEEMPAITLQASEIEDLSIALTEAEPIDLSKVPVDHYAAEYESFATDLGSGATPTSPEPAETEQAAPQEDSAEAAILELGELDQEPDPAPDADQPALSEPAGGVIPLPANDIQPEPQVLPPEPAVGAQPIGAIVKRIEAFRLARQVVDHPPLTGAPRLPLGEETAPSVSKAAQSCDFATNAQGRVVWCASSLAPMLAGTLLIESDELARLFKQRLPMAGKELCLRGAPAIAGEWRIDAVAWFDPLTGGFQGYRGRLRRPAPAIDHNARRAQDTRSERMRQMLHELRTPVNAIQGFAEILQQQLFGPTPHQYRALAASIASDAARMLSAFEELERLARLDGGALELEAGSSDFCAVVAAVAGQLNAHSKARGSGFGLALGNQAMWVSLARIEPERIVWRLLATLCGTSSPEEVLPLALTNSEGMVELDVAIPATLAAIEGDAIFTAGANTIPQVVASGVFGIGFALRLARAEARAAGGDLVRRGQVLILTLPALTTLPDDNTPELGSSAELQA